MTTCLIDAISGNALQLSMDTIQCDGIHPIQVIKPEITRYYKKANKKIQNLIEYIIYCEGVEYINVLPPKNPHTEALKIKALYPILEVEVFKNRIKISI